MATEVIGREQELAELQRLFDETADLPAAVLLEGEPGIGKTVLWEAGIAMAQDRGFRVLAATPAAGEARLSFAALADLLEPTLDEVLPELPAPQRHALEVALLLAEPQGPPPDARAVDAALLGALRGLATKPLVVAVDDVQWLDAPSAAGLAFAVRRLNDEPIALLLTIRVEDREEHPPPLELGRWAHEVTRIELGPLSAGALQHLLRTRLGLTVSRPTLRRVLETAAGNPFYALQLGRALERREGEPDPGEPVPIPRALDDLLFERLGALPAETLEVLLVAASLAEPTLPLLDAGFGARALTALRPALDSHIVEVQEERVRFTHPLLASSVYLHADSGRKRTMHKQLSSVVHSPEERARHLALASEGPSADAAAALDDTGRMAAARGAPSSAAELLELAIRLTPPEHQADSIRRTLEAAAYQYTAGNLPRARELAEPLYEKLPPGAGRAQAALQVAWTAGDMADADQWLARALAEPTSEPAVLLAARYFATYVTLISSDVDSAQEHARAAVELAEAGAAEATQAQCLAALILTDTHAGGGDEATVQRALELEARNPSMPLYYPPSLVCGQRAIYQARFEESRSLFETAYRRVIERGDETMVGGVRWHQVELECRAGNWELAGEYAAEGLAAVEALDTARQVVLHYAYALIAAHQGRVTDARTAGERGLELARSCSSVIFGILIEAVLGFLELSLGRHAAAAERLRPVPDALAERGWRQPSVSGAVPDLVEALVGLGEIDEAGRFLERLEDQARETQSVWASALGARCRGLVAAAEGDVDLALSVLEGALQAHERLPEPFERARTLLVLGTVRRRANQRRAAREALSQARSVFDELGAPLWSKKAKAELVRIGGRRASGAELTPTEERVAELVAQGLTNKAVADALFVSDRTVEGHLSRVYAKLGVRSRAELMRRLALRA